MRKQPLPLFVQFALALGLGSALISVLITLLVTYQGIGKLNDLYDLAINGLQDNQQVRISLLMAKEKATNELIQNSAILIIISAVFSVFLSSRASERITRPLEQVTDDVITMQKDLAVQFSPRPYDDCKEVAILVNAFEDLKSMTQVSIQGLEKARAELENRVAARTFELSEANTELETAIENLKETQAQLIESQKQTTITSLVRGIAHHMNTPVGNALIGVTYAQSLLEKTNQKESQMLADSLASIHRNLERTVKIIDTLKKVSVQESIEDNVAVTFCNYVNELISLIRMAPENKRITFDVVCEVDQVLWIKPVLIMQVINVIVENAREHGFTSVSDPQLSMHFFKAEDFIHIKVADNGPGIAPDMLDKIFEPFETSKPSQTRIGMGLNIAKSQLLATGGNLTYLATDKGASFDVIIPYSEVRP